MDMHGVEALPWTCITFLLQTTFASEIFSGSILETVALICNALVRSYILRQLYTDDPGPERLERLFVVLYVCILECLANAVRYVSAVRHVSGKNIGQSICPFVHLSEID
jgi:hypothetical protein